MLAVVDVEIESAFEGGYDVEAAAFDELPGGLEFFGDEEAGPDVGLVEFGVADARVAGGGDGFGIGEVDGDEGAFAIVVQAFEKEDGVAAVVDAGFEDAGGAEGADENVEEDALEGEPVDGIDGGFAEDAFGEVKLGAGAGHLAVELGEEGGVVEELVVVAEQEFGFLIEIAGNLEKVQAVALAGESDIHVEGVAEGRRKSHGRPAGTGRRWTPIHADTDGEPVRLGHWRASGAGLQSSR